MELKDVSDAKLNILIMLFVIFVGIVFAEVQNNIGFKNLLYSVLIIGMLFSFSAWVISITISNSLEKRIICTINECANTLNVTNSQIDKKSMDLENCILSAINKCAEQSHTNNFLIGKQSQAFIDHLKKVFHIANIPDWIITTEELEKLELENAKSDACLSG